MVEEKTVSPLRAIRAKCLNCMCASPYEVARCDIYDCSLWPLRFGKGKETAKRRGKCVEEPAR
jgi:hypothetical protein